VTVPPAESETAGPTAGDGQPWLRRPAASDRVFAGDERVSTASAPPSATPTSPALRALTAPTIRYLAAQLAVPLFVGRPDPALNPPPVATNPVNGS